MPDRVDTFSAKSVTSALPARQVARAPKPPSGLLAGMRIRKKLIFLHTLFSIALAAILALALRPAVREVILLSESHAARQVLAQVLDGPGEVNGLRAYADRLSSRSGPGVVVRVGDEREAGLTASEAAVLRERSGLGAGLVDVGAEVGVASSGASAYKRFSGPDREPVLVAHHGGADRFVVVSVRLEEARGAVIRLYVLATLALLSVYALVAAALEIFVLPRHVYGPIRSMLEADRALEAGRTGEEIIPERVIPADELGEIMRSRNRAVRSLRQHESDLASALTRLEHAAADLKKKNHLLETARQNLADTGRLAGLGMMSAGLAHEMNTPLAVLKVLAEKVGPGERDSGLTSEESALMRRVIGRLEGLSEGLLDIARARPLTLEPLAMRSVIDEAWTLVRMDRRSTGVRFENRVESGLMAHGDGNRLMQVFVNLLRNAVDSMSSDTDRPEIEVTASGVERDGRAWVSVVIADNGPGIAPDVLANLFEPFVSTRLDSHGTGLGLAVSEGIVREHGGVLVGRNRGDTDGMTKRGAEFEVLLPGSSEHVSAAGVTIGPGVNSAAQGQDQDR